MKTSDVIRLMRPYQRLVAPMVISDVVGGMAPRSFSEAISRYAGRMGESVSFDNGKGWSGDIREAAIWTLFRNGFAKGKVVKMSDDGTLTHWTENGMELEVAAAIETEFGGNRALSVRAKDIVRQAIILGEGAKAVYVYTDSRLDSLGDNCTKIGRHHLSGSGEVLRRILGQYSTGNPGYPVLRIIAKTDTEVALESFLHRAFRERRIEGGFGYEWFAVKHQDVLAAIEAFVRAES
ncbi:GIY-YIG nuclease family protein [Paracoccus ravus]|uniref:GIY-YIG nuclease family protein n=1 Tax=Paracoccus ravus TaxID=2447760 RepID=UPI00106EA2E9|nr:GIY-YIG nuclease family protein [Paracoccus ravus]